MRKNLTKKQAEAVWKVLVEECGARHCESDTVNFVQEYSTSSNASPAREWRVCGALGFGGKFRYPNLTVNCYPEDETPARLAVIKTTNERLAKLKVEMGINLE